MNPDMSSASQVLIVDDDQLLTRSLTLLLEQHGYNTSALPTAERLIEFLDGHRVDLLILDIGLPGIDGLMVLERIKNHPKHRDLPVMMLSSAPPEETSV